MIFGKNKLESKLESRNSLPYEISEGMNTSWGLLSALVLLSAPTPTHLHSGAQIGPVWADFPGIGAGGCTSGDVPRLSLRGGAGGKRAGDGIAGLFLRAHLCVVNCPLTLAMSTPALSLRAFPENTDDKPAPKKRAGGGGGGGFMQRPPPPKHGEKDIPQGSPTCLSGMQFVVTVCACVSVRACVCHRRYGGCIKRIVDR